MNTHIDFMGIGTARAGTTWLWSILNRHPGIWMPPIKELHYFDRSLDYASPSILAEDKLVRRMFGGGVHHAAWRALCVRSVGASLLNPGKWGEIAWKLRYFLGTYNDDWYFSLFRNNKTGLKGEVTPAYAILTAEDVRHVHDLLPDLKVIYLIRNPVERTWSGLRYRWVKGTLDIEDLEAVRRTIDSPSQTDRGDYVRTIQNWSACYPKEQFSINFYDDIVKQPHLLVSRVLTFLGLGAELPVPAGQLRSRVNASREKPMPPEIKRYLAQKYHPEVQKLIPLVGGYAEAWLKDIEASI